MKQFITTRVEWVWDKKAQRYFAVPETREGFEYEGPLALCDRGQSKKVANQGMQQSAQDQSNAQQAFGGATGAIGNYQNAVSNFMRANPYTAGGEYQQAQESAGNNVAAAGQNTLSNDINRMAARTNENDAGNASTIAESRRQGQRNLANFLANSNQQRIGDEANYNQAGLQAEGQIPGMYSGLYGTSTSGATGNLGPAANAAKTPGFWDEFGPALIGAAGGVAGGFIPHGGGSKGCWIAAELFGGWDDPRTIVVREWLNREFALTAIGKLTMWLYRKTGKQVAMLVRQHKTIRAILAPLFRRALARAREWERRRSIS